MGTEVGVGIRVYLGVDTGVDTAVGTAVAGCGVEVRGAVASILDCWLHATIETAMVPTIKKPAPTEQVAHLRNRSGLTAPSLVRPGEVLRADDLIGFKLRYLLLG